LHPLRLAIIFAFALPALEAAPPEVFARSAILFDVNTGEVLYRKNDTLRTPVASTQKILTSLIVAKSSDLDGRMTIEKPDTDCEPTKLFLKAGDSYERGKLLTALLIKSANDIALALARDNAGSVAAFADKMNREAARLGARNSHFVNPNGLPADDQYSTARDMACVARAVYRSPVLRDIISRKTCTFEYASGKNAILTNTNRVLRTYSFCNGMKTGYTSRAGHCLIASGSHAGRDMIAVVLGSDKAHVCEDAASLLEYGLGIKRDEFASTASR